MNTNLTLGAIVFLLWSTFSSWYYVCQIKGLCFESITDEQPMILSSESEKSKVVELVQNDPDTLSAEEKTPEIPPINIKNENILFKKNAINFLDASYVKKFTNDLASEIEGRKVEIVIVGFTCDLGRASYNLELGRRRAEVVKNYMTQANIMASKFDIQSKGEEGAVSGSEAQRQKRRKVSITIKSID